MRKEIANHIKQMRLALNYKQAFMAAQLGTTRQRYSRLENGVTDLSLKTLEDIARIFDCSVRELTDVPEQDVPVAFRKGDSNIEGAQKIYDMLDLFYANKHLYELTKKGEDL